MTSLTFQYDIVGSEFNINNMKARIRPPLWCGTFFWHTLGTLVLFTSHSLSWYYRRPRTSLYDPNVPVF